jgi:hypothetical protein
MCTLAPLNFTELDAKAQAMKLPVRQDLRKPADASGFYLHSKSWLMPLTTGPHEFVAAEGRGPNGDVTSCGIAAPDAFGEEVKRDLAKAMKLGKPISEAILPNGKMRATKWLMKSSPTDVSLLLTDGTPVRGPGIYLTLTQVAPTGK